jgi:hypothetical protein
VAKAWGWFRRTLRAQGSQATVPLLVRLGHKLKGRAQQGRKVPMVLLMAQKAKVQIAQAILGHWATASRSWQFVEPRLLPQLEREAQQQGQQRRGIAGAVDVLPWSAAKAASACAEISRCFRSASTSAWDSASISDVL